MIEGPVRRGRNEWPIGATAVSVYLDRELTLIWSGITTSEVGKDTVEHQLSSLKIRERLF